MKNILYKKYIGVILLLSAVVIGGCTERELSERPKDGVLKINLEWPDGHSVEGASLWLYGSDGSRYSNIECMAEGHECRVPADSYTILVTNSDCSNAGCHDSETSQACCMKAERMPDGDLLKHVGKVFCTGADEVMVKRGNQATEITLYPENTVKKIHFRIDPNYIEDIADMDVRMVGVVPSVKVMDGSDAGEATGEVSAKAKSETGGLYSADMSVFGWRGENIVTVTVIHTDGSTEITIPQDISEQLAQLPKEGGTVNITLFLPDGGEIALTVTVKAWESGTGSGTVM